jgi:predicted nucleic-acid-binding protein
MRGLDTNVLVRYLINDEAGQVQKVDRLVQDCRSEGEALFIPVIVICEMFWVLDRVHKQSKPEMIRALEELLELDIFEFEQEAVLRASLDHYRRGKADFADYVIGEISRQAGCRYTVTFDRALGRAPGYSLLA